MSRRSSFFTSLNKLNRSFAAVSRAQDRLARAEAREQMQKAKERARLTGLEQARLDVEAYEDRIDFLTEIHKEYSESIEWHHIAAIPEPCPPQRQSTHEVRAQKALDDYMPSFWHRLFKREQSVRDRLEKNVQSGRLADDVQHQEALRKFDADRQEWESKSELARRIIARDPEAMHAALDHFKSLYTGIGPLGGSLKVGISNDGNSVEVELTLDPTQAVPSEVRTLLASGKCSVKKMPKSRGFELQQSFVCGCVLRIARETLGLLPVDIAFVNVKSKALSTATGRVDHDVILSVAIDRETLFGVRLQKVDAPDCMRNFVCRMDFNKSRGFSKVEPIERSTFVSKVIKQEH